MIIMKVWEARIRKKLTLIQLAEMSGISKSTLSDIENIKVYPRIDQLEKIALALDISIEDLYESVLDSWTSVFAIPDFRKSYSKVF